MYPKNSKICIKCLNEENFIEFEIDENSYGIIFNKCFHECFFYKLREKLENFFIKSNNNIIYNEFKNEI